MHTTQAFCNQRERGHVLRLPRWHCHVTWRPGQKGDGPAVNNLTSLGATFLSLQVRGLK
jgi:hypothetical protein